MKTGVQVKRGLIWSSLAAAGMILAGCATITENSHEYLGTPHYPPTAPASVVVLTAPPKEPIIRLGEVILSVDGNPPRERLEARLRAGAAQLGADGVYIASDQTHIYPVEYWDYWGPADDEYWNRLIVGVAFRNR